VAARVNYTGVLLLSPYRGYTRVSGLTETDMSNQQLTAGGLTKMSNIGTGWTTIVLDGGDNPWTPVLYSYTSLSTQAIGAFTVYPYFTSQNSRKFGHGS